MNKLNFDLKLEIFHRTQQMRAMEKKLEQMQAMAKELERMRDLEDELEELREVEENNQRLREENEKLQKELDKRDAALAEAVELICKLEATVEELKNTSGSRPSTSQASQPSNDTAIQNPEITSPRPQIEVDIPDRTSSKRGTARRTRKAPSFLREESRETATLRSLYLGDNKSVRSFGASTFVTAMVDDSNADPPSPRLSMLSECSEFSIRDMEPSGRPVDGLERLDQFSWDRADEATERQSPKKSPLAEQLMSDAQRERINSWIQPQRDIDVPRVRRPRAFSDASHTTQIARPTLGPPFECKRTPAHSESSSPQKGIISGKLPPTPDTMHTSQASSTGTVVKKGSFYRSMARNAFPSQSSLGRPRSVGEWSAKRSDITPMSDATEQDSSIRDRREANGIFSFNMLGRGNDKVTRLLGPENSNDRSFGGDIMFNGEDVEDIESELRRRSLRRSSSFESTASRRRSTSSPPLSPQEWLEAAQQYAPSDVQSSPRSPPTIVEPERPVEELTPEELDLQSEQPVVRPGPGQHEETPPPLARRRLSLRPRFFQRNQASRDATPELSSGGRTPSPITAHAPLPRSSKSSVLSVAKHRRTGSGPNISSGKPPMTPPAGNAPGSSNSNSSIRPGTAGTGRSSLREHLGRSSSHFSVTATGSTSSPSQNNDRRRGSLLLLGWMKGHKDSSDNKNKSNVVDPDEPAPPPPPPSATSSHHPGLNCESDWRARRRSRRMG